MESEHAFAMGQIAQQIQETESSNEATREKLNSGVSMTQTMRNKLETTKTNLTVAEELLQQSLHIIQAQAGKLQSELSTFLNMHSNASDILSKQLQELEETQSITEHSLAKWDEEEKTQSSKI